MAPKDWPHTGTLARFQSSILRWYDKHARDLPWRKTTDPYHVWVSEIMLQQTLVATVLRYYGPFLARFPTIAALAAAEESEVLHAWQGLGYYRRARNLHKAAQIIVREYGGTFPATVDEVRRLPGLGRYTGNAIICFSADSRLPILEANTVRLWTRLTASGGNPAKAPLNGALWDLAERALPQKRPGDFNQALMDIGSQLCTAQRPECHRCPIHQFCLASAADAPERYPEKPKRTVTLDVDHVAVVLRRGKTVLISQCPPDGRWANLWEFPRVEQGEDETPEDAAHRALRTVTATSYRLGEVRLDFQHGIMHYRVRLRCFDAVAKHRVDADSQVRSGIQPEIVSQWVAIEDLHKLPFSSPQRRILRSLVFEPA